MAHTRGWRSTLSRCRRRSSRAGWTVSAHPPATRGPTAARGRDTFLERCAACHTIRGTGAAGRLGPDLTHVGSRLALGAGVLPNDPGALAAWIARSQHVKPGNLMPSFGELTDAELRALTAYLAGLE